MNTLFFQVLSKKVVDRDARLNEFLTVPYLNSSLFEPTILEDKCFTISNLRNGNLPFFSHTVLKDTNGNRRIGELAVLDYFFEFLN